MSQYRSWISLVLCVLGVAATPLGVSAQAAAGETPGTDPASPEAGPSDPATPPPPPPAGEGDTGDGTTPFAPT